MREHGFYEHGFIADELQHWLDANKRSHENSGSKVYPSTHVIPPAWPTREVIENWIHALRHPRRRRGKTMNVDFLKGMCLGAVCGGAMVFAGLIVGHILRGWP